MKPTRTLLLSISAFFIILTLAGCSSKDSDQDFGEDMYDAEYMATEYVDQLVRDGAETVVGTVEITGEEGDYIVTVDEKKVVANANYEDGYYIADKNMTQEYPLGSDQGILARDGEEIIVCSTEDFLAQYAGDEDALYTVYLIGDTVELLVPLDPATAIAGN